MRRSTSPPTSASTLSSSFNGGGGGSGGGGGDITTEKVANNERKDEWAGVTELQPIPGSLERCGLGLEEWENMLSEPGQEQSLLRWIAGDVDDNSCFTLKHTPQSGKYPLDFDGNGGQMWSVDQGPVFESVNGVVTGNLAAVTSSSFAMSRSDSQSASLVNTSSSLGRVNYSSNSNDSGLQNPLFGSQASTVVYNHYQQQPIEVPEKKPLIINSQVVVNQQQPHLLQLQGANFLMPLPLPQEDNHLYQPQFKRQNSGIVEPNPQVTTKVPLSDPGQEFLVRKHNHTQQQQQQHHIGYSQSMHPHFLQKPVVVKKDIGIQQHQQQQQQLQNALLDQLYKASELVGTGNFSHAQGILARLNQQLSPIGKPLNRAAFYFKEALQLLLLMNSNSVAALPPRSPTPFDVIFKMGAYKVFSEMSPLIQFANFTCNQALLEALDDADRIHIIDFDVGFGAQWASFMQELPQSRGIRSLKITAIASPSTHHPLELSLMQENLTQFANEIGIGFELDVINIDSLEQNCFSLPIFRQIEKEAIAVNFPIWSCSHNPSALPSLLRFVKQLSPKIVVSLDRGCDRPDLPFPQHILHALQCYIHLLESLDTVNGTSDTVNKIERFLLQPRIESTVLGRLRAPDKMPSWKTLFASAGFSPISFSNFTETLAESIAKRTQARGFQVEKRQALLVLCWQNRDLISASAWRC